MGGGANVFLKGHLIEQKGTTVLKGHFTINSNYTHSGAQNVKCKGHVLAPSYE